MIDYSECTGNIRIYEEGKCYEKRDEYIGHVHVVWLSKTKVKMDCVIGKITRRSLLDICSLFKSKGVDYIITNRCKGKKMPFAKPIQINELDITWKVDLINLKNRGLI